MINLLQQSSIDLLKLNQIHAPNSCSEIKAYSQPHQDDRPKLFDFLTTSVFAFDTPSFSSFIPLKGNSSGAILLSWYKSENILKVSD